MNVCRVIVCAGLLLRGTLRAAEEIELNASLPPVDASAIAPLHCFGRYPQLDEGNIRLGLSLVPLIAGAPAEYDWVYEPGSNPLFRISSPSTGAVSRISMTLWNWFGYPVAVRDFEPGKTEDIQFDVAGNGTWMITLDACDGPGADTLHSRLIRSFSVFPDCSGKRTAWETQNQYRLGSCFFPQRYFTWKGWDYPDLTPEQAVDKTAALAARAGFSMLRIDSFPDGSSNGWKNIESTFQTLEKYSITPDWKIALRSNLFIGDSLDFDPEKFGAFERRFDELIKRYGSGSMIELGNEPAHHEFWGGSGEQYIHLYQYLYKKIHAANPDILITHGGACYPGADSWQLKEKDPETFRKNAAVQTEFYGQLYDALALQGSYWPYHFHGGLDDWNQIDWINGMRRRLAAGEKPLQLFQTEGGACAWRPDFEATVWVSVIQKFFYSWGNGDRGWLQYALISQPTDVRTEGGNEGWCLLHSGTFAPRFQYGAWAAVADWFAGCRLEWKVVPSGPDDPLNFVYVFDHPDGKIVSCFSEDASPAELRIESDARQVLRIDPMGNAVEAPGANPPVVLKKHPQYILLKGATSVRIRI
jgi:hypothetical protein